MCVTSMVGGFYEDQFRKNYPQLVYPNLQDLVTPLISRAEFEELKKTVLEMKELLTRAKLYDQQNDQPDCEMSDKVALLKRIAELVGVDISKVV